MYIKRTIEAKIRHALDNYTKPLCILGARQVGKSTTIKHCLKEEDFVYVNLFDTPGIHTVWSEQDDLSVSRIVSNIELVCKRNINKNTIIVIDEIQCSAAAVASLKSFNEDGQYKVVALGSNLGSFILQNSRYSFPVGQIKRINMYPISFYEFLIALGEDFIAERLKESIDQLEINPILHEQLLLFFDRFIAVGGMPEVVQQYVAGESTDELTLLKKALVKDYINDFGKYETAADNAKALNKIYTSIPMFLNKDNQKFIFSEVNYEYKQIHNAFKWLQDNNYIHIVHQLGSTQLPLISNKRDSSFKLFANETSLLLAQANYDPFTIIRQQDKIYYGFVMENYVATVLSKYQEVYTYRKGKTEIDFLFEKNNRIYALEVKSGNNTKAKSLSSYKKANPDCCAIKLTRNNLLLGDINSIPLYALDLVLDCELLYNM